jgi:hypothetical protein
MLNRLGAGAMGAAIGASLLADAASATAPALKVGAVTWHAAKYAAKDVRIMGFVLARDPGYILFSDEPNGSISAHDLPVTGPGITDMMDGKRYLLVGRFVKGGLQATNGNLYHLELTAPPVDWPTKRAN